MSLSLLGTKHFDAVYDFPTEPFRARTIGAGLKPARSLKGCPTKSITYKQCEN
jgi:hypothetical protein